MFAIKECDMSGIEKARFNLLQMEQDLTNISRGIFPRDQVQQHLDTMRDVLDSIGLVLKQKGIA